jgi:hypothetical protein
MKGAVDQRVHITSILIPSYGVAVSRIQVLP